MIHLDNDDVRELLSMADAIEAMRIGIDQLVAGTAAHVPRLELWSPAAREDGYHCLGSMSGTTSHFGITAIRIKSDVILWPDGARQEKHAVAPGTYCGFVLLFETATGAPVALVNDGILQQIRVGASAAVAVDHLAAEDASTIGIIGSGAMARSHLEAISLVRHLRSVTVYSPDPGHRRAFAEEMSSRLDLEIAAVDDAAAAVAGRDVVVTATNAMQPTIPVDALDPGTLVTCVTRREVGPELVDRADRVIQLGPFSVSPDAGVPGLEFPQSGAGGFVAGTEAERARLPWRHRAETRRFTDLTDAIEAGSTTTGPSEVVLFLNVGLQGLQFAAVGGALSRAADERRRGDPFPVEAFLQDVRD